MGCKAHQFDGFDGRVGSVHFSVGHVTPLGEYLDHRVGTGPLDWSDLLSLRIWGATVEGVEMYLLQVMILSRDCECSCYHSISWRGRIYAESVSGPDDAGEADGNPGFAEPIQEIEPLRRCGATTAGGPGARP
jgi:hypothetical protein